MFWMSLYCYIVPDVVAVVYKTLNSKTTIVLLNYCIRILYHYTCDYDRGGKLRVIYYSWMCNLLCLFNAPVMLPVKTNHSKLWKKIKIKICF